MEIRGTLLVLIREVDMTTNMIAGKADTKVGSADVVVGVDGSAASIDALRYARTEARRTEGTLRVVHVLPDYAAAAYPLPLQEVTDGGRAVLRSALTQAGVDEGPVRTVLRHGTRVASLVADARGARLLVVGADRRPLLGRLLTGNTSTGVAATAATPVVSVPEGWSGAGHGVVLAAVKRPAQAIDLLGEAFSVAQARGSRLQVLHAWRLPSEYDDGVAGRPAVDGWDARARRELEVAVAEWRASYPDVVVELRVVHDQPAHALVAASQEVDELVLVRRAHGFPAAVHLGLTARTVLRESACPVRVVPPGRSAVVPGLVLEGAGGVRT